MTVRADLPPLPARIARLPVHRGYPVPWFVATIDGVPDFRVTKERAVEHAYRMRICWLCGDPLGANVAYVAGPMCAINRTSSEPPAHRDCAIFAARACPFLARPHARRREEGLPEDALEPAGTMLKRNPGVTLVWVTRKIITRRAPNGMLFDIGEPTEAMWFRESRPATRAEVDESISTGLPLLQEEAEKQGPLSVRVLARLLAQVQQYLPKEPA